MIKINLERETYVHTLSDAFIDKVKQALMEMAGSADEGKDDARDELGSLRRTAGTHGMEPAFARRGHPGWFNV